MAIPVRSVGEGAFRSVGGIRELIQDLVTPDLKAMKSSHEALQHELRLRTESISQELKLRFEALQEELRLRDAIQTRNFQVLDSSLQKLTEAVEQLALRSGVNNLDLRERVTALEARQPRT